MEVKNHVADSAAEIEQTITPLPQFSKYLTVQVNDKLENFQVVVMAGRWEEGKKTVVMCKFLDPVKQYPQVEMELDNQYEDGAEALKFLIKWAKKLEVKYARHCGN